jgi:heme A synthase
MPFGRSRELDIHLTHRALMYVSSALVIALFLVAWRRRRKLAPAGDGGLFRATAVTTGVLAVQVLLGALNVWLGKHAGLVVAHLTVATVLWASLVHVAMLALPEVGTVRSRSRAPEAEAAPA